MPTSKAALLRVISLGAVLAVGGSFCPDALAQLDIHSQPVGVVVDGRDDFTLLDRRLVNRQLFEQLSLPDQGYRLGRGREFWAAASALSVGSQQTPFGGEQSRYHGFFIADTLLALRPFSGFDANFSLLAFNPSASDGYRVSSYVLPQAALHVYDERQWFEGVRGRFDLLATDLDEVTLGRGLLLESMHLEGVLGRLALNDFGLSYVFGGRVFWSADDLESLSLDWKDRTVDLTFVRWSFSDLNADAYYLDLSTRWALFNRRVQLAAELGMRLNPSTPNDDGALLFAGERSASSLEPSSAATAALGRVDYMDEALGFAWHLGYQFRWYAQGFGPRDDQLPPSINFNLPLREQAYVTNSFEYFGASTFYDQWSHTLMAETVLPLGCYFRLVGQTEYIHHVAADPISPDRISSTITGEPLPGSRDELWYRAKLELRPWLALPHRLSGVFTNKQVLSRGDGRSPQEQRFEPGDYVILQMELFL